MKRNTLAIFVCAALALGGAEGVLAETRATAYTYTSEGLIESINGPRTDVADVTTYTYDTAGNLQTSTNALNHVTQYTDYDAAGRLLRVVDPNGLVTSLTYHPRGWLLSQTVGEGLDSATTLYDYDAAGNVILVTLPSGGFLSLTYDAANRLVKVEDGDGNFIEHTLDGMGNRIVETTKDPQGNVTLVTNRVYTALNRLKEVIGADPGRKTVFTYDKNGNVIELADGLARITASTFDALDRVTKQIDPATGETHYGYDARDNLTSVTDPRGNTTQYQYNAFDEQTAVISPDTGTSSYSYDPAGNLLSETDARNVTVTYTYDALNRVTSISFPDPALDVSFTYDQGPNGIGRLTQLQDASGTTDYSYDLRGRLTGETRTEGSLVTTFAFGYDNADHLTSLTYPSGNQLGFAYDPQGKVTQVTLHDTHGGTQTLADNLSYLPFGPLTAMDYGNGLHLSRTFDADYRLTGQQIPGILEAGLTYDVVDNIKTWTDALDSGRDQQFDYDVLDRLENAQGAYGVLGYTYDGVGNRETLSEGGITTQDYLYETDSNRLSEIQGGLGDQLTYDDAGNTTASAKGDFTYDDRNRLVAYSAPGVTATYAYNGLGERVQKTVNGETTYFRYLSSQLIGEYDAGGAPIREYVYLNGEPIAMLAAGTSGGGAARTVLQYGSVDHVWTAYDLGDFGSAPVIITGPASYDGSDALVVGVRNVSGTHAELALREWNYLDGVHKYNEDFGVLAIAPGVYPQTDGSTWEVGRTSVSGTKSWQTVSFDTPYATAPKVFVTLQTANESDVVVARVRNVTTTGFDVALYEEEARNDGHGAEELGYLVVHAPTDSGTVNLGGVDLSYELGQGEVRHEWVSVSGMQLKVHEEQSKDSETGHYYETVATLKLNNYYFAQDISTAGTDPNTLRRQGTLPSTAYQSIPTAIGGGVYYAHSDHLGSVAKLTDSSGAIVWDADRKPFGEVAMLAEDVTMPLRFPGQYHDQESGLYYNYFRDYDPTTGRYVESDPIGLLGGINTYAYVGGNPLSWIDAQGLDADTLGLSFNIPFVGGVEFGISVFDGTNGGGLFGTAGLFDIGVYGTVKKPYGGFASGTAAISLGQTIGCRSNFEGVDVEASLGVGPIGGSMSMGDTTYGNEGYSLNIGPTIGYEAQITATGAFTFGDLVRGITSLATGSDVPWHGNDGCGCPVK